MGQLEKAISLNRANEVAYYQLATAYGRLGQTAEQRKALAEFQRLQAQKKAREDLMYTPGEVTKQEIDPGAPPP